MFSKSLMSAVYFCDIAQLGRVRTTVAAQQVKQMDCNTCDVSMALYVHFLGQSFPINSRVLYREGVWKANVHLLEDELFYDEFEDLEALSEPDLIGKVAKDEFSHIYEDSSANIESGFELFDSPIYLDCQWREVYRFILNSIQDVGACALILKALFLDAEHCLNKWIKQNLIY